ncbi:MAG TPA: LysE family transporter [Chloroflexota bacterium]
MTFFLLGAGIGLVAGLSPGPVLTLVVAETMRAGWPRGAAVAAGPLLADGPIIALAIVLLAQLPAPLVPALSILGGLFLLYLALTTMLNARRAQLPVRQRAPVSGGLLKGVLARGLSPNPYLFWFLVGAPTLLEASRSGSLSVAAFLVGYYGTIVGSNVGLAVAIHAWLGRISARVYRVVLLISALILAVYGALLLGRAVQEARR